MARSKYYFNVAMPFTRANLHHHHSIIPSRIAPPSFLPTPPSKSKSISSSTPGMSNLSPPASPSTPAKPVAEDLIQKVTAYVRTYMSNYDPSHDYNHIRRVSSLAQQLHAAETSGSDPDSQSPAPALDPAVVRLAALLHDVGDKKYLREGEDAATMVRDVLLGFGAGEELAARVQAICLGVSYSSEVRDPGRVKELIELYPERELPLRPRPPMHTPPPTPTRRRPRPPPP